jgi:hypothetical protein
MIDLSSTTGCGRGGLLHDQIHQRRQRPCSRRHLYHQSNGPPVDGPSHRAGSCCWGRPWIRGWLMISSSACPIWPYACANIHAAPWPSEPSAGRSGRFRWSIRGWHPLPSTAWPPRTDQQRLWLRRHVHDRLRHPATGPTICWTNSRTSEDFGYIAVSLGYFDTLMSCSGASTSSEISRGRTARKWVFHRDWSAYPWATPAAWKRA